MNWYVLHLRSRAEKKVAEVCQKRGLSYYLPLRRETRIYQRRKVTFEKPLFPGYLFAAFDHDGRIEVLKTNHVVRIIQPASTRELLHELAQIRRALRAQPDLNACPPLAKGVHVRIKGGPFMGVEGVISTLKGETRVTLNVDMIGQAVAVEVDKDYVEVMD
jgi:transcription antitermination factor NusG